MNARRRKKADGLPNRVYKRSGTFWWVRNTDEKWQRLCRVSDGETRMLERLAEEKRKLGVDLSAGSMVRLLGLYMTANEAGYAESYRDEWRRRGGAVKTAFEKWDIQQVDAGAVADFLHDNWADKLPTYQAMHGWLSKFFGWCIVRRHITTNPCREIEVEKPKARRVYIPHAAFLAIRAALETYSNEKRREAEADREGADRRDDANLRRPVLSDMPAIDGNPASHLGANRPGRRPDPLHSHEDRGQHRRGRRLADHALDWCGAATRAKG
jgi:hypothetical protein